MPRVACEEATIRQLFASPLLSHFADLAHIATCESPMSVDLLRRSRRTERGPQRRGRALLQPRIATSGLGHTDTRTRRDRHDQREWPAAPPACGEREGRERRSQAQWPPRGDGGARRSPGLTYPGEPSPPIRRHLSVYIAASPSNVDFRFVRRVFALPTMDSIRLNCSV